jgi:thiol-disulfide isomerase/thioredoxin
LVRIPGDTVIGGLVYIDMDTLWLGYNGQLFLWANRKKGEYVYGDALEHPGLFIQSTEYNGLVDDGFLRPNEALNGILADPTIQSSWKDTLMNGAPCVVIHLHFPDGEDFKQRQYTLVFNTHTNCLVRKVFSAFFQGNEQYNEWNYSDIVYDHQQIIPQLLEDPEDQFAIVTPFKEEEKDSAKKYRFDFLQLKGKILGEDRDFQMGDCPAEFVILDFWYTACYPCIKSIPAVNQICDKYGAKGVSVYGVNTIDDEQRNKARLEAFRKKNPMHYPSIMLDDAYDSQLQLEGFPTLMILNKEREIIFEETGFQENLFEVVSRFLDARL